MTDNNQSKQETGVQHLVHDRLPPVTQLQLLLIDKIFTTIWLVLRYASFVSISYIIYLAIKELAGQQTVASFVFEFFTENGKSGLYNKIWMFASLLFLAWAYMERKLRLHKVSNMSEHIKKLEKHYDPSRTSSGLTKSGETPLDEGKP